MSVAGSWIPHGDDQARLTNRLRSAVQNLQLATSELRALSNVMSQMNASGTNYTTIETYFSVQAGSGQAVNDIVGSCATELETSNVQAVLQRLG